MSVDLRLWACLATTTSQSRHGLSVVRTVSFTGYFRSPHTISTYFSDVGCRSCDSHSHTYQLDLNLSTCYSPSVVNANVVDNTTWPIYFSFSWSPRNFTPNPMHEIISKSALRRPLLFFFLGAAMNNPVHTVQDLPSQSVIGWDFHFLLIQNLLSQSLPHDTWLGLCEHFRYVE